MAAANYDITIYQGASFSLPITISEKTTTGCKGSGKDLSAATISASIYSGSPNVTFSLKDQTLASGMFTIFLTAAQTTAMALTNNTGKYRVKINYGGSPEVIDIVLTGRVTLVEED